MLIVPESLNRNSKGVQDLGDPADTGAALIDYMCERIGIANLDGLDVLDFGCGVRFSQSILNQGVPIGTYTGVEVKEEIISFLKDQVTDPRLSYHYVNAANQLYNPSGENLRSIDRAWLANQMFDVACMFSVITHQRPDEANAIFALLRDHIRPDGCLFFSAFIHEDRPDYKEVTPDRPGLRSSYSLSHLISILEANRWDVISVEDRNPRGLPIMSSLLCKPWHEGNGSVPPGE